jgi:hypothetical protein
LMGKRRRKSSSRVRSVAVDSRGTSGRRAGIWLATLSTVVGVATGMFTLRDEVFPNESGSAAAVSRPAYEQQVGRICDQLNEDDRERAREAKTIRTKLPRARTTLAQRNLLLDGQRRTIARSGHALATFTALATPDDLAAARRTTAHAWSVNLDRLRAYALRLDRAGTRAELIAAIDYLSDLRPRLAETGVTLMAGLRRVGGSSCDIHTPITTPAFTLPTLHRSRPARHRSKPREDRAPDIAGPGETGASPPPARGSGHGSLTTPGPADAGPGPSYARPPGSAGPAGPTGGGADAG